jgi:cytochrome c oxidase subunit IV
VICFGAILITLVSYFRKETFFKWFLMATLMVLFGVIALFVVSSFGGLGKDALSPWWGLVLIPYPVGWIMGVVLLIKRALHSFKNKTLPNDPQIKV